MKKDNFIKTHKTFLSIIIILNIFLIYLRLTASSLSDFSGNIVSTLIFTCIVLGLLYFFFTKRYDYFIILWLSFYFACPIIVLPFTLIGSLGILNVIFIPLMLYSIFNLKNKYFIVIAAIAILSALNLSDVGARIILSDAFLFLTPLVFFVFVLKRCQDMELIMWSSVFIALINIPLGIYEILFRPMWGIDTDWRGFRIFGNLFWHNSYSFYLLPIILTVYAFFKETGKKMLLVLLVLFIILDIFTFSRSGLLALVLSLLIFEFISSRGFKINAMNIVLCMAILSGIFIYTNNYIELNSHLQPDTLSERTMIWDTITPYMQNNLIFGNGIGSYTLYRENFLNELSSHNFYIFILFELGFIGLILFAIFIFNIFMDMKKGLNRYDVKKNIFMKNETYPKKIFIFKSLGIALLIGIVFFSFFGNAAFSQVISLNSWILLACCVKYNEENNDSK